MHTTHSPGTIAVVRGVGVGARGVGARGGSGGREHGARGIIGTICEDGGNGTISRPPAVGINSGK